MKRPVELMRVLSRLTGRTVVAEIAIVFVGLGVTGLSPRQAAAEFAVDPLVDLMTRRVQQDIGVGIDDTSRRMLLPQLDPVVDPDDPKSLRLAEKVAEARKNKDQSLLAKMWVYSGLYEAPYNIFDFRVSRHRDGPEEFFKHSRCKVQGDCLSGNQSVVHCSDCLHPSTLAFFDGDD